MFAVVEHVPIGKSDISTSSRFNSIQQPHLIPPKLTFSSLSDPIVFLLTGPATGPDIPVAPKPQGWSLKSLSLSFRPLDLLDRLGLASPLVSVGLTVEMPVGNWLR